MSLSAAARSGESVGEKPRLEDEDDEPAKEEEDVGEGRPVVEAETDEAASWMAEKTLAADVLAAEDSDDGPGDWLPLEDEDGVLPGVGLGAEEVGFDEEASPGGR